ncbi:MAG: flagellar basal-body MS-ring/collar protein FliF, partial [Pseudomonadota bacterium]
QKILEFFRNAGTRRLTIIGLTALVSILFLAFLASKYTSKDYSLLFSNVEEKISLEIRKELARRDIDYEIKNENKDIYVPEEHVRVLRVELAEIGLAGEVVGYEIFDREQSLGTSAFLQNINRLRALEGELARTIGSVEGVRAARVHLVLPERPLFSREEREPKATVFLQMETDENRLSQERINAVQYLLSTAVPGLTPGQISIIDDQGTLLARGGDGDETALTLDAEARIERIEKGLRTKIENILGRTIGFDSVRVAVRVEMDLSEVVVNNETYNPDGQVLRSNETIEELSSSNSGVDDVVTVGNNIPNTPPPSGIETGSISEQSNRVEERNNYEISRVVQNTIHRPGRVKRISVAVLVDGFYETVSDAVTGNSLVYRPRSTEDLERIEQLVKGAIGYDEVERNDEVSVVNMQFERLIPEAEKEEKIYWGFLKASDLKKLIELSILAGLGLLIILLIIRPLVAQLFETAPVSLYAADADTKIVRRPDGRSVYVDPDTGEQVEVPAGVLGDGELSEEEFEEEIEKNASKQIDIDKISGRLKDSSLRKIHEIVERHPEEAVAIIRGWLNQES